MSLYPYVIFRCWLAMIQLLKNAQTFGHFFEPLYVAYGKFRLLDGTEQLNELGYEQEIDQMNKVENIHNR